MNSTTVKFLSLILIFLLTSIVISQSGIFNYTRLDMTENKLFTLNKGTINILENIDEEIQLKLYFSDEATQNIPLLRTQRDMVVDLIKEMVNYSDKKLKLNIIDPKLFTPEEDEASQYGLQSLPLPDSGENVFFGLIGENSLDNQEIIPFFQPGRESFLEYDIAQLIHSLNNPEQKTIGIMSSLDLNSSFDPNTGESKEAQVIIKQLEKDYILKTVDMTTDSIDSDIDVLMIVHPKSLSDKTLFSIDQFVMKGGRLLVFVDPFAQNEVIEPDPQNPMASYQADRNSNLEKLFKAWNVQYNPNSVLLDDKFAMSLQRQQGGRPIRHLGYLALEGDSFNEKDLITRDLDTLNLAMSGYLESENLQAILSSSKLSSTTSTDTIKFLMDPNSLYQNFKASEKKFTIAGRLTGEIRTAFPEGIDGIEKADVIQVLENPNVLIFADVDMLFDQLWARSQNFFGRKVFNAFADNGNMIVNLMDNMSGSPDLIHIRGRKNSARPFTKFIELQTNSDKKFRETENLLKQKLKETEQKLNEIQRRKGDQNRLILSQEQELELQEFQKEKLDVRKKLREVRRNLNKDIQDMETRLKVINIGLIPILITLLGVFLLWFLPKKKGGKYAK